MSAEISVLPSPRAPAVEAPHLDGLNAAQREAAAFGLVAPHGWDADPLLILAGAGSGKTQTLSHRAAHLVLAGVDPRRILLLTFSRRAAGEMTRRAHAICAAAMRTSHRRAPAVRLPWAGTFHAIGARLLREYAPRLGLEPAFSILDRGDAGDLMDVARHDAGLAARAKRFPRKDTCLAIYSATINQQARLVDVLANRFPWCVDHHDDLKRLFADYTMRKHDRATLDYDDLLLYWSQVMQVPALAAEIGGRFDHVLIDEYQDTNNLQAGLIAAMKPDGRGVTAVGDDAQAIYGFRGATVEHILDFGQRFCGTHTVTLSQNYRSTQAILDAANTLMDDASRAYAKRLFSERGAGCRPRHVTVLDSTAEAGYVADAVLARRETGVALRQQAVLFRNGHHANELEIELIRRDVPFRKYGGLKFLEAAHVKDFLALVRWADNPRHEIAAWRAMQLVPGVGPGTARQAMDALAAANDRLTALAAFRPPRADREAWRGLIDIVARLAARPTAWPVALAPAATWIKAAVADRYEAPTTAREADIDDLVRIAGRYGDAPSFLTELTLDPPQATGDHNDDALLDEDYLVLSTVHSAKGQEWDSVHVLHVADGTFPSEFATRTEAGLAEERRLLYVAMTRAKNELALISPLRYYVPEQPRYGDRHVYGAASRFLTPGVLACFEPVVAGDITPATPQARPALGGRPAATHDLAASVRALWD
ncbi:ATP-dependent helicase [Salinisphaera sp. Q1T1-3]|uniref:ATP-dependent helicase n=1 Tax=Salinisphaera sp. Q1T1-3 TaxID=2321229 RepID=UPI000E749803|nr:ATP-dependent helicase [Salinisphaera sp. Q1T1-3]RJS91939.1 ATP-dependent helicase [Salinisphaera sp. Q1T1-3]